VAKKVQQSQCRLWHKWSTSYTHTMTGCAPKQIQTLPTRMSAAFKQYADTFGDRVRVGALTDIPDQNRALILSCGQEFVRILEGKTKDWESELPQLRADLIGLLESGCPPLDIIDFMFACTRGRSDGISDSLEAIGLKGDPSLNLLRMICHLVSAKISALNTPHVPGPLFFLPQLLPELSEEDRARLTDDLKRLPELLAVFGDLLTIYPPKGARAPKVEELFRHSDIALFYALLNHFDVGYPTLSVLLRTMRRVRYATTPKARYVHRFGRVRVKSGPRHLHDEPSVRDPLNQTALQKRLHRFFSGNGDWHFFLHFLVLQYLSPSFSEHRTKAVTLRAALPTLMKSRS
jgi:hypothetical protein